MDPYVEEWVAEFAATADRSPDAMCLRGSDGHVAYLNSAAVDLVGATMDEAARAADWIFGSVHQRTGPVARALAGGVWTGDVELTHCRTHDAIPVWVSAYVVTGRHAAIAMVALAYRDLRGRFDHERRLVEVAVAADAHAREQRAVADLSRIALTASPAEVMRRATAAALSLMGMKCAVILEPGFPDRTELRAVAYSGPDSAPGPIPLSRSSHAAAALLSGEAVVCADRDSELRFPTDFMRDRGVHSGAAVVIDGMGEPWGVLAVYSTDPTDFDDGELAFLQTVAGVVSAAVRRHDLENELRRRTLHDPLTGLPNRVLVRQRIRDIAENGNPYAIALLVIDLDNFKTINDTLGHAVGDATLRLVAELLADAAGPDDTVSRFGGDEFVVLHRGPDAVAVARRILADLAFPFEIDGYVVTVSASIGIAVDERYEADADDLLRKADSAMYAAKNAGTSGFSVFDARADHDFAR
ncbi:diguanylate cyclase domain-containing protein [Rhodococcoides kyotonense]|uniref:Diguanylate cyclase (GGDEF) domain-containing protein n=1 Tax=Rhodococcoides kyotonense TaxID=398843 RepID=A0A239GRE8_9NOCA|nr:diguanylate cyclase [Rhodococcus kyotonensis]SNS70654.1 diguanylate cyclase (GGDEF) domain-containing protein [Rhodococcus kyotonensis]